MSEIVKSQLIGLSGIVIPPERMRQLRSELIDQLVESIREQGQLQPISVRPRSENGSDYILIAGRHRLEAVRKLGHEGIRAEVHAGLDADRAMLVEIDENLMRGELSPGERAAHTYKRSDLHEKIYGKPEARRAHAANAKMGRKHDVAANLSATFTAATAVKTGQSQRTVRRDVQRGEALSKSGVLNKLIGTSLDKGDELDALAKLPAERQTALAERAAAGEKISAKTVVKQEHRAAREQLLADKTIAAGQALGRKIYGLVYMDPASRFEVRSRDTGLDRAADNHYPTEIWEEIAKRPPPLAKDAILACWSTRAQYWNTARMIVQDWGLEYKTCQVWGKPGRGTGYTIIDNAELLLIAARGRPVWPAMGTQPPAYIKTGAIETDDWETLFPGVIEAPKDGHSVKPEVFAEQFTRLWPNTPKLEMYARRQRDGWDSWGNEAEPAPAADRPQLLRRPGAE